MSLQPRHILADLAVPDGRERFDTLCQQAGMTLQRVVSPAGYRGSEAEWYDQDQEEFVLVLQGRGALQLDGQLADDQPREIVLNPGDFLHLPAHQRHRVAWTDPLHPTVWLTLHFSEEDPSNL